MASSLWPEELTRSLWNTSVVGERTLEGMPLMGVKFQAGFLWAFLFGGVLVFTVAWRNLRKDSAYTVSSSYKIINELNIGDLGGKNALNRASMLYAGSLCVIYIALTFFGKLILEALNAVPEVGVRVDTSIYHFDSPQWPLLIAFGFAGMAPMLPPVQIAEASLRRRTYRAVGIPVRIEQSSRKILEVFYQQSCSAESYNLYKAAEDETNKQKIKKSDNVALVMRLAKSQEEFSKKLRGTWLEHDLQMRSVRWRQMLHSYAELDLMIEWANGLRGAWPGPQVPEALRAREQDLVRECEERLDEILIQMKSYSGSADMQTSSKQLLLPSPKEQQVLATKVVVHPIAPSPTDVDDKPHRLSWLKKVLAQIITDRDNLVAILAIYAEKDSDIGRDTPRGKPRSDDQLNEPMLKWLLDRAINESLGRGPELEAFLILLPAFILYFLFTSFGLHELIPRANRSEPLVVIVTAGIETLRLSALVTFPVLVSFAIRQSRQDAGEWIGLSWSQFLIYVRHLVQGGLAAGAVALVGLFGISTLLSFVSSESAADFRRLLLDVKLPNAKFYLALAPIAVTITMVALLGADLRWRRRFGASLLGIAAAALVLLYQYYHLKTLYGKSFLCPFSSENYKLFDYIAPECFLHYNGLDFIIYPTVAFLVTAVFGQPVPAEFRARDMQTRRSLSARSRAGMVLLCGMLWLGSALPVISKELRVGFREDVEPFSYLSAATADKKYRPYRGYLATLCYSALESRYTIISVRVTLEDRFERLRSSDPEKKIDVLCDPVTLRLNQDDRLEGVLFSQIVFASSVTYLEPKQFDRNNPVLITYGKGSTAAGLAKQFCRNNISSWAPRDQRMSLSIFCDTAEALLYFTQYPSTSSTIPAFCRLAKLITAVDCLKHAVEAELNQAKRDRDAREEFAYTPEKLKRKLGERVNNWQEILDELLEFHARPNDEKKEQIVNYLGGFCEQSGKKKEEVIAPYRFCPMSSHDEMIKWFCDTERRKNFRLVYLGDREIIVGKHRSYEMMVQSCPVLNPDGGPDLTYEPYVILVRKSCSDVFQYLQIRIYELFSDDAWARSNYEAFFGEQRMSLPLAYLFLLNAVDPPAGYANTDPLVSGTSDLPKLEN